MSRTKNLKLVVEIFDEVFDAPSDKKAEILQARCNDNSTLRGEVEKMLSATATEDNFLKKPMFEDAFGVFGQESNGNLIGQKLDKMESRNCSISALPN